MRKIFFVNGLMFIGLVLLNNGCKKRSSLSSPKGTSAASFDYLKTLNRDVRVFNWRGVTR
jgi:hypothetical protein